MNAEISLFFDVPIGCESFLKYSVLQGLDKYVRAEGMYLEKTAKLIRRLTDML